MTSLKDVTPRQPYTGDRDMDIKLEKARLLAENNGRLRYVPLVGRMSIYKKLNCICMGARDWATIKDGHWNYHRYAAPPKHVQTSEAVGHHDAS